MCCNFCAPAYRCSSSSSSTAVVEWPGIGFKSGGRAATLMSCSTSALSLDGAMDTLVMLSNQCTVVSRCVASPQCSCGREVAGSTMQRHDAEHLHSRQTVHRERDISCYRLYQRAVHPHRLGGHSSCSRSSLWLAGVGRPMTWSLVTRCLVRVWSEVGRHCCGAVFFKT